MLTFFNDCVCDAHISYYKRRIKTIINFYRTVLGIWNILLFIIMFIIHIKARKTIVAHTHNTEINYLRTRLLSYTNTFTQEKKT